MHAWGLRRGVLIAGVLALLAMAIGPARATQVPEPRHLRYVALGDSYTSGPIVLPHDTTWVPQDCGQSIFNYPHLAAIAMDVTQFTDVSCGSATIDDLYRPQDGLPIGGTNAAQLDAVHADTDIITLGMGGNDVGFVGLASDCIRGLGPPFEVPCTPALTAGGKDPVATKIASVGPELGRALDDLHAKAPHARIFVVGYPAALPDDAVGCWPYLPILQQDLPYLVAKFKQMNAMLRDQAELHDATYVDIYTSSIGHDACKLPGLAWVNGLVIVPPSLFAHPNQLGLANSAGIVAKVIREEIGQPLGSSPAER